MQTRSSCSTLQTTSDESNNYDIDSILHEINVIEKNLIRSKEAEKALGNKGMSRSHWNTGKNACRNYPFALSKKL